MLSDRTDEAEWFQYRRVFDVDGNVDARGSRWRFATNSVVFKVRSDCINHYSSALIDGIHFIELSETLADLKSKTAIMTRNDIYTLTFLANISRNARETVAQFTLEGACMSRPRSFHPPYCSQLLMLFNPK